MRSFAFSSIQDQRAELERGGRGGEEPSVAPLSRLHPCYTVSDRLALQPWRLQTDTQRCFVCFISCTVSSSRPPPSSHIWFGFFLVCFCRSLGFGFVWFLFGLGLFLVSSLKKKSKNNKKHVTPAPSSLQRVPAWPFFVVGKDQSRINKETPPSRVGFLGRAGWRGLQQRGVGASSSVTLLFSAPPAPLISTSVSVLCSCVLAAALIEKPSLEKMLWFPFEN